MAFVAQRVGSGHGFLYPSPGAAEPARDAGPRHVAEVEPDRGYGWVVNGDRRRAGPTRERCGAAPDGGEDRVQPRYGSGCVGSKRSRGEASPWVRRALPRNLSGKTVPFGVGAKAPGSSANSTRTRLSPRRPPGPESR